MIYVDHYFRPHQTPKKCQNYFPKNILRRDKRSITWEPNDSSFEYHRYFSFFFLKKKYRKKKTLAS